MGLAIYSLKNRSFHARLLRKEAVACEQRFQHLTTTEARINESVAMNLEFAKRVLKRANAIGLKLGFSIQPIIDRYADGRIHPATQGAITLTQKLGALCSRTEHVDRRERRVCAG